METYIVTFEIEEQTETQREALTEKLKEFEIYCPIHLNCWAVVSDKDPVKIIESLDEVLPDQIRIFVIQSGKSAAWRTYSEKHSEWLKERL